MLADTLRILVVRPVLTHLNMWSQSAEELMMGTMAQESAMGRYYQQIGGGPALGFFQVEPATEQDVWENFLTYKPELRKKIIEMVNLCPGTDEPLMSNALYSCAIARCCYYRQPEPLPAAGDKAGQANYWKKYYNTIHGAGTVDEYLHNYKKHVGS